MRVIQLKEREAKMEDDKFSTFSFGDYVTGEKLILMLGHRTQIGVVEVVDQWLTSPLPYVIARTKGKYVRLVRRPEAIEDGWNERRTIGQYMVEKYGVLVATSPISRLILRWISKEQEGGVEAPDGS